MRSCGTLPDFLTESGEPVELPEFLVEKWTAEGRLDAELAELDAFFERTGYPRAPRYYVMKWLTDWVREYGFDGYRVDTTKHFEEALSAELADEARLAFEDWKAANPEKAIDDRPFWFMGEVYNYAIDHGRDFDFGDRTVDYFAHGYDGLINFGFKSHAQGDLEELFSSYSSHSSARGRCGVRRSSTTPARTTTVLRSTRIATAPSKWERRYCSRPVRLRSTTATSWRGRSGSRAPKATRTSAR